MATRQSNTAGKKKTPGLGGRSVEVLMTLRRELDDGVYPPGSKLPTERELCRRFKASRPTIFRAISHLVEEGRVVVRWGAGMFVRTAPQVVAASKTIAVMYPFRAEDYSEIQSYVLARRHLLCAFSQFQSNWNPNDERLFLEQVRDEGHRGLVAYCSPKEPHNDDVLRNMVLSDVRVVHIEPYTDSLPEQSYVMPDYPQGGYMAAVELLLRGAASVVLATSNYSPDPEAPDAPYVRLLEHGLHEGVRRHGRGVAAPTRCNIPRWSSAPPDSPVGAAVGKLPQPVGVFCLGLATADQVARALGIDPQTAADDPRYRILAFDYREPDAETPWDTVVVDHRAMLERAIDLVTADDWDAVRELVPPTLARDQAAGAKPH